MKETIQKRLSDSKTARWTALFIVSFTMMCGYFLTDVRSASSIFMTLFSSACDRSPSYSVP